MLSDNFPLSFKFIPKRGVCLLWVRAAAEEHLDVVFDYIVNVL